MPSSPPPMLPSNSLMDYPERKQGSVSPQHHFLLNAFWGITKKIVILAASNMLLNLFLTYSIWGYQHVHKCWKAPRWRCISEIDLGTTATYMTVTEVPIIILRFQSCSETPLMWEVLNYSTWMEPTRKYYKPVENIEKKKTSRRNGGMCL